MLFRSIVVAVVEDDVAFTPENQGLPPSEIEERVAWALERVGMAHKRSSPVSALRLGRPSPNCGWQPNNAHHPVMSKSARLTVSALDADVTLDGIDLTRKGILL